MEILNKIYPNRYKCLKCGYKFDRLIFNIILFTILGYLLFIAYSYDFKMNYFICGETKGCINPFYTPTTWENIEHLDKGEYGTKPGPLFNSAKPVSFGLLILGFLLNHLIYNKGFFKDNGGDIFGNSLNNK